VHDLEALLGVPLTPPAHHVEYDAQRRDGAVGGGGESVVVGRDL